MTQVTPIYSFPYPENTDAPDGPSQFHALALAVETALSTNLAGKQPLDADLTALAALAATPGYLVRTGAAAFAVRTFTTTDGTVSITNPAGTAAASDVSVVQSALRVNSAATATGSGGAIPVNQLRKYLGNLVVADIRVTLATAIAMNNTTGLTTNTAVINLPAGFRPVSTMAWTGSQDNTGSACGGVILITGNIEVRWSTPGQGASLPIGTNIYIEAIFNLT